MDRSICTTFVNDESEFDKCVDKAFAALDVNNYCVLSRSELRCALEILRLIESHFGMDVATTPDELTKLYDSIFEKFHYDHNGTVDHRELEPSKASG